MKDDPQQRGKQLTLRPEKRKAAGRLAGCLNVGDKPVGGLCRRFGSNVKPDLGKIVFRRLG